MRTLIGTTLLAGNSVQPRKKPFEIYDTRLAGFTLRVQPSGARYYYARSGRSRRISLGKVGSIVTAKQAAFFSVGGGCGQ